MKKIIPFHPIFFAVFPVVFLASHNINYISEYKVILLPVLFFLSSTVLVWLGLFCIVKDRFKSAIMVSLILFYICYQGSLLALISKHWRSLPHFEVLDIFIGVGSIVFAILTSLIIFAFYRLKKTGKDLSSVNRLLNVVSIILFFIPILNILTYELKFRNVNVDPVPISKEAINISPKVESSHFPDIYYIVLERYTNPDILKRVFHYDMGDFIRYLKGRGFFVASRSFANYGRTYPSMASALNLNYLDDLAGRMDKNSEDQTPLVKMIKNNRVAHFLKSMGYQYLHIGSHWLWQGKNEFADIDYDKIYGGWSDFSILLFQNTVFYPMFRKQLRPKKIRPRRDWKWILWTFDRFAEIPRLPGRKFVLAHLHAAHDPFVFDRDGQFVSKQPESFEEINKAYVDQLAFTNQKLKRLIETLLSASENPPIIILQGDEGPFPRVYYEDPTKVDWQKAPDIELQTKNRILNAYFFPGVDEKKLYDSMTPVNTFRFILNHYFGMQYRRLPDRSFAQFHSYRPYNFFEVTDRVRY